MPFYVHEVDARVVPEGAGAGGSRGLAPEEFERIVTAVLRELERRQQQGRSLHTEAAITGQNRPPTLGT